MVEAAVLSIGGKKDIKKAWDAISSYQNKKCGKGNTPTPILKEFTLGANKMVYEQV